MNENWKPVVGSDRYLVSDLGNVWDKEKERFVSNQTQTHNQTGKPYVIITLTLNGKQCHKYVSVLVLSAFKRVPKPNECADYRDGDSTNIVLSNLKWIDNPRKGGKVSEEMADKIRQAALNGTPAVVVAADFGISTGLVYAIKSGFRSTNAKLRQRKALGISVPKPGNRKTKTVEPVMKPEQEIQQSVSLADIPQLTGEEWRAAVGIDRYLVSNCGRLWDSATHRIIRPNKKLSKIRPTVELEYDGQIHRRTVALLVLQSFCSPLNSKGRVGYKDSNEWNVRLTNLEWTTLPIGVSPALAARIKRYLNRGLIISDAAQRTGLSIGTAFAIKHNCCRADLACVKRTKAERSERFHYDPELMIA